MFREPPRPISPGISETKQEYCAQAVPDSSRIAFPPNNFAYCEVSGSNPLVGVLEEQVF